MQFGLALEKYYRRTTMLLEVVGSNTFFSPKYLLFPLLFSASKQLLTNILSFKTFPVKEFYVLITVSGDISQFGLQITICFSENSLLVQEGGKRASVWAIGSST